MAIENIFYAEIEEKVRPYVRALRNVGINTTGSCEHEGYIYGDSFDPTHEIDVIYNVLYEMRVKEWSIRLYIDHEKGVYLKNIEIRSPDFKKKETDNGD